MQHQRFDLAYWRKVFERTDPPGFQFKGTPGASITGPRDICELEVYRAELRPLYNLGREVPCDVFVFALGEPENRAVTKFGGVPCRPASLPWPREPAIEDEIILVPPDKYDSLLNDEDRAYMQKYDISLEDFVNEHFPRLRFLAQFNFADSRDIVGPLPGDVLLLFGCYDWPFVQYYEWHPLGLTDLIHPSDVPDSGYTYPDGEFVTCYGQIYRTCDYPEAERLIPGFHEKFEQSFGDSAAFRLKATRIGGAPFLIQAEPDVRGEILCVLDGLWPRSKCPWPWLNREAPLPLDPSGWPDPKISRSFLDLDASLYISIDDEGQLHWIDQCT